MDMQSCNWVRSVSLLHLQPSPTYNLIAISLAANSIQDQQMKTPTVPNSVASWGDYPRYPSLCNTYIPGASLWMATVSNRNRTACFSYFSFPQSSDAMRLKSLPVYCTITLRSVTPWYSQEGIDRIQIKTHPTTLSWPLGTFSKFHPPLPWASLCLSIASWIAPLRPYVSACSQCNWAPQTQIPMKTEQKRRERQSMLNVSLGLLSDSH